MMRDLGSLIIVHLVEKLHVGAVFPRKRAAWPLHVTLVPWFYIDDKKCPELLNALHVFGATTRPFAVHVGGEEFFGSKKNVPVNLIKEQSPVAQLHDALLVLVQKFDAEFHSNASAFSGVEQKYRAHITHHEAIDGLHRRFAGDQEIFDSITVARLLEENGAQMCEIVQNIALRGIDNETAA